MRGKVHVHALAVSQRGITPACAGKSKSLPSLRIGNKDHPRVCGEKSGSSSKENVQMGSPPRVRGKVLHLFQRVGGEGITPAYAGKSCASLR